MSTRSAARLSERFADFVRSDAASSLTMFAIAVPLLLGAVGVAVDFGRATLMKAKLQAIADGAATLAAREMQLATATPDKLAAFAKSYVDSQLSGVATTTKVDMKALTVRVKLDTDVDPVMHLASLGEKMHVGASATAQLSTGLPLCLIGLDGKAAETIGLRQDALLTAPGCLVYSNSKSPKGISSKSNAVLKAGFICSAGGKSLDATSNFTPQPETDCPTMPDPLASRPLPAAGACNYLAKVVLGGNTTLHPGVYCGGLIISLGASVKMAPGIYVIKDGPFLVNGNAKLSGDNVGIYMKGLNSNLKFDAQTTIDLTAPKSGPMAGLLILDDPSGAPALLNPVISGKYTKLLSSAREHLILSNNARTLLGTIYMPKGRLIIDANQPVADKSAYTVLVVQQLDLYSGPNLILNSNYGGSEIPVPAGVGIYGAKVAISQ
jgi:Flp pilus assembly protein TadG